MTDLLVEALRDTLASYPNACMPGTELDWCADHLRNALRERGVHLVTARGLARAAQNHETSGIHGSLHCSLACGASLFAALEEA